MRRICGKETSRSDRTLWYGTKGLMVYGTAFRLYSLAGFESRDAATRGRKKKWHRREFFLQRTQHRRRSESRLSWWLDVVPGYREIKKEVMDRTLENVHQAKVN